ncbi:DUF2059 domain-containing protein [Sphingomonas sp.]|uniref:DUF2059 domain-containing protein n=1 Tax=Sphingomonas sp. TaxID=28214 RepID=UPI003D6C91E4
MTGMLKSALLFALMAPAPLAAQTTPSAAPVPAPPSSEQPLLAPIDTERLAAARPVIERIWPLGTYERLMRTTLDQTVGNMMSGMYGMKMDDIAATMPDDEKAKDAARKGKTLGEAMKADDPYFEERMRISMRVMADEMSRIMTDAEPEVREALTKSYARRFTVAELGDLDRFFATPTGTAYARDSMLLMMGPDMMHAMQAFAPRMMKEMPAMTAKIEAATKHLPPARGKKK